MEKNDFLKQSLTSAEAQKRLEKFGRNELIKTKDYSFLETLVSQFKSPLIYILIVAGLITFFLKDFTDSLVIFLAVFVNTFLGFYQEAKAQKTMEALRNLLVPKTKVIRDGLQQEVLSSQIVPGDIAILTIGSRVPADGILIEATDLSINEAILTGESMPVAKSEARSTPAPASGARPGKYEEILEGKSFENKKENLVFMGTTVSTGIAKILVTKTGMATKIGNIGKNVSQIRKERTPLQIQLDQLAKSLAWLIGGVILVVFVFGSLRGYQMLELFTVSVALAVAAIPEGLVVILTIILALGMQKIVKRKAILRKLLAAETLGSVSVICSDKTGTLTEGKMRVVKAVTKLRAKSEEQRVEDRGLSAESERLSVQEEWLVKAAILCNDLRDPLEIAMLDWAGEKVRSTKSEVRSIQKQYPRLDEIPFNHKNKYIATLHSQRVKGPSTALRVNKEQREKTLFLSGAPEVILAKCKGQRAEGEKWLKKFEELGKQGYRLVAFAYKKINYQLSTISYQQLEGFEWLGVLVYEDPVREGVKEALQECRKAGIKVKVITGDYPATALAVLEKLDIRSALVDDGLEIKNNKLHDFLADRVLTGEELKKMSDSELRQVIGKVILFARTDPEQKLKIVEALKESGEVVAMTGDGVNDAPALAKADIGIVVGDASDVAKETADMVLLDSNFSTMVAAVEEGRNIYENIKKVALYLLSDCSMEVVLIGGALVLGLSLPLTATQIIWIKLVEDIFPGMALAMEPGSKELMLEPPRSIKTPFWDNQLKILVLTIGLFSNLVLLLFYWLARNMFDSQRLQTVMFVALTISSLFIIFSCRSLRKPFWRHSFFSNRYLLASVLFGLVLLFMAVYWHPMQVLLKTHPLGWTEWVILFSLGFFNLLLIELAKWVFVFNKKRP